MIVRVGSVNRAKLAAVEGGLAPFFPGLEVCGAEAPSGIPEQPVGWDEIRDGARARARGSWVVGGCELACGIEDGLLRLDGFPGGYANVGCCVLYDGAREGMGLTPAFAFPRAVLEKALGPPRRRIGPLLREYAPTEADADDATWGSIGRLTNGVLTRTEYARQAVVCALASLRDPREVR